MRRRRDNVTNIDDFRVSRHDRAVKKQRRNRLVSRFNEFLQRAEVFFDKANSERGKRMIKDQKDD